MSDISQVFEVGDISTLMDAITDLKSSLGQCRGLQEKPMGPFATRQPGGVTSGDREFSSETLGHFNPRDLRSTGPVFGWWPLMWPARSIGTGPHLFG